jgi:hypothetical protein
MLAKFTPPLFVDNEETNPNKVDQWKRTLAGGTLVTWGLLTNVAWYVYTSRFPSQIVLHQSNLWVKRLAFPSLPNTIPLASILPTSRRCPKDHFLSLSAVVEALTTRGRKVRFWLHEEGTYNNKTWFLNLIDFAAKKAKSK